jgi:hypothetical protein
LIVKKDSNPLQYTNAYLPEDVVAGFEFKAHRVFGAKNNLKSSI